MPPPPPANVNQNQILQPQQQQLTVLLPDASAAAPNSMGVSQAARHMSSSVSAGSLQQQQPARTNRSLANSTTYNDLRAHSGVRFTPLSFHPGAGKHAYIVDNVTARRHKDEFSQGCESFFEGSWLRDRLALAEVWAFLK